MSKMSKKLFSVVVSLILSAPGISAARPPDSTKEAASLFSLDKRHVLEPILTELPDRVAAAIVRDRLVSLSMAIVLDGEILFCRAYGHADLKKGLPATEQTIYPIASVTKIFTATMLAQLAEGGRMGLEDPVSRFLPEYQPRSPFPWAQPTTLRELAAHTSGLPQDAPVNFWCDFSGFVWLVTQGNAPLSWFVDKKTLLVSLDELEIVYPPEVQAHYSNLNMQILGLALERACGQPFPEYIKSRILLPLGMNDTGFQLDPEQRSRLARGYVFTGPDTPPLDAPDYDLGCALYSGGLYSTAPDLAKFLSFALDENPAKKPKVLSPASLRRMRTPQSVHRPGVNSTYGLGWGIVRIGDHDAIEHNGALLGYSAHVSAVPDLGLGIIALSNTKNYLWRPEACKDFARQVLADLADALEGAEKVRPFSPAEVHFGEYTGRYVLPGETAVLSIFALADGLRVSLKDTDFDEVFEPVSPDEFCFKTDARKTPMLFFNRNAEGRVAGLAFLSHTFRRHSESAEK
jgi:CubicO group peptidase (beta-lactamase class C family)